MAKPKTKTKPRLGVQNAKSPESRKVTKNQTKKHERREGKKEAITEKHLIANFIKQLSEKKYAEANKYLKELVEAKLKAKVAQCVSDTLF